MPLWDFKCEECGAVREVLVYDSTPWPMCDNVFEHTSDPRWRSSPPKSLRMARQFPSRGGKPIINGFSEENGYSTPDERFKPVPGMPGVKVQTRKGRGWKD